MEPEPQGSTDLIEHGCCGPKHQGIRDVVLSRKNTTAKSLWLGKMGSCLPLTGQASYLPTWGCQTCLAQVSLPPHNLHPEGPGVYAELSWASKPSSIGLNFDPAQSQIASWSSTGHGPKLRSPHGRNNRVLQGTSDSFFLGDLVA